MRVPLKTEYACPELNDDLLDKSYVFSGSRPLLIRKACNSYCSVTEARSLARISGLECSDCLLPRSGNIFGGSRRFVTNDLKSSSSSRGCTHLQVRNRALGRASSRLCIIAQPHQPTQSFPPRLPLPLFCRASVPLSSCSRHLWFAYAFVWLLRWRHGQFRKERNGVCSSS